MPLCRAVSEHIASFRLTVAAGVSAARGHKPLQGRSHYQRWDGSSGDQHLQLLPTLME